MKLKTLICSKKNNGIGQIYSHICSFFTQNQSIMRKYSLNRNLCCGQETDNSHTTLYFMLKLLYYIPNINSLEMTEAILQLEML